MANIEDRPSGRVADALRLLGRAPAAMKRNPDLLAALTKLSSPRTRGEGAVQLARLSFRKLLEVVIEQEPGRAVGFAEEVLGYRAIEDALRSIDHFGVLQPLTLTPATRHDYVQLWVRELFELKERAPHLALASSYKGKLAELKDHSRLEIAQTIAIAANLGHLFGTFASERALLSILTDDPSSRDGWFRSFEDAPSREVAMKIVREADLYRFHYALALHRIPRLLPPRLRRFATAALRAFITGDFDDDRQIEWAVRTARRLAYGRLHGFNQIGSPIGIFGTADRQYAELLGRPELQFHQDFDEEGSFIPLLAASEEHVQRAFFSSPPAAALVVHHVVAFKQWWRMQRAGGERPGAIIDAAFVRPSSFPIAEGQPLDHFLRLEIPASASEWLSEEHALRADPNPWSEWRFLVSPIRGARGRGDVLLCDVYRDSSPSWEAISRLADRVAQHVEHSWERQDPTAKRTVWRSASHFGCQVLSIGLKPDVLIRLQPVEAVEDSLGLCIVARTRASLVRRLDVFLSRCQDEVRRGELQTARSVIERMPARYGPELLFLARLVLKERETNRELGDLDGAHCQFEPTGARWTFMEAKDTRTGTGEKQLARLLQRVLGSGAPSLRKVDLEVGGTVCIAETRST